MQIDATVDKNLAKVTEKVTNPMRSRSYNLCVKADALRFAKMYKESVQTYLQAIMTLKSHFRILKSELGNRLK